MEENKTAARGEDIIAGRNAVTEALKAGRTIDSIYVARATARAPSAALLQRPSSRASP